MSKENLPDSSPQNEAAETENPYVLPLERLTAPDGPVRVVRVWLNDTIALQREGIDQGVRPQNLRGVPSELQGRWVRQVWSYYRKTLSSKDNEAVGHWYEGRELHTFPMEGHGQGPNPIRFRHGKPRKI